jgi:hypothetical protein
MRLHQHCIAYADLQEDWFKRRAAGDHHMDILSSTQVLPGFVPMAIGKLAHLSGWSPSGT